MNPSAKIRPASEAAYEEALHVLSRGGLVALPTETVYGLAADATNDDAVQKVYALKGRPAHNPLIVHVMFPTHYRAYGQDSALSFALTTNFWPAPLTLVLPQHPDSPVSRFATAGLGTVALRCPAVHWTKAFRRLGFSGPLVMPSANPSGRTSPTTAQHVAEDFGDTVDLIIDGGPCPAGLESTVIKIENEKGYLLRPGTFPIDMLTEWNSAITREPPPTSEIASPGMLKSHYAPKAQLRLNATSPRDGEQHLGFGDVFTPPGLNLSESGSLVEAATHLFAYLRDLDKKGTQISVAPIPDTGLGEAINDRLRRAAADR